MNSAGTTSKLSSVEVSRPPITVMAMGELKLGSPLLRPMASGIMPAPMAMVVITMGRLRLWQASIRALVRLLPSSRARMA